MDVPALRALVRDVNFKAHGVPATVTVPDGSPVSTRIIWLTPINDGVPNQTLRRDEPRRSMAIRRDDVLNPPRGTVVEVTEHNLDSPESWTVDATEEVNPDHTRVFVVPVTS